MTATSALTVLECHALQLTHPLCTVVRCLGSERPGRFCPILCPPGQIDIDLYDECTPGIQKRSRWTFWPLDSGLGDTDSCIPGRYSAW